MAWSEFPLARPPQLLKRLFFLDVEAVLNSLIGSLRRVVVLLTIVAMITQTASAAIVAPMSLRSLTLRPLNGTRIGRALATQAAATLLNENFTGAATTLICGPALVMRV
jgi:hypothetical protein